MNANQKHPYQPTNRLLTLKQVALEFNFSLRTLQRRQKDGDIILKPVKFGKGRPRYKLSDVTAIIVQATKPESVSDDASTSPSSKSPTQLNIPWNNEQVQHESTDELDSTHSN